MGALRPLVTGGFCKTGGDGGIWILLYPTADVVVPFERSRRQLAVKGFTLSNILTFDHSGSERLFPANPGA